MSALYIDTFACLHPDFGVARTGSISHIDELCLSTQHMLRHMLEDKTNKRRHMCQA